MKKSWDRYTENDVTPEIFFHQRRKWLKKISLISAVSSLGTTPVNAGLLDLFSSDSKVFQRRELTSSITEQTNLLNDDLLTPETKVLSHNNFYEFGTSKIDPKENAQNFKVDPWSIKVDGLVGKSISLSYEDLFNLFPLEERIYRFRCVEAWSMVIPWVGFPLSALLKKVAPLSNAKYVAFKTLYDPTQMPGQNNPFKGGSIDYPYVEGLTISEAMNELSFIAVGLYGKTLAPQNGAPIRLVVPWKYGFKSIKSLVHVKLTEARPETSWNQLAPNEYGFYANVNPEVDHPRWSQATERRLGAGGLFSAKRIQTLKFNGYEPQVAHLYKKMNLREYF